MSILRPSLPSWADDAVVYQIYPRSFADADGDGLGDIPGVTSRVPYLSGLGVDAVWLSPFYPSALADGGYDVDDYRDVDPRLGTLADVDDLIAALHGAGIRIVIDIVPNHSSNRHRWFREALAATPGSPARDRYVFRDGAGPDGALPPSDWVSHFGGSAWTRVPDGQWYLHLFAPEQPDFNWDNPEVHDEFLATLRFWADRGVDGFRIDVAHTLKKDLSHPLRSKPSVADEETPEDGSDPLFDRDDVHEIYRAWRRLFDEYDPPRTAVAEAWVPTSRRPRYALPDGLGQAFNFDLLRSPWDAASFRSIIELNLALAGESGSSSTWVLSNHDVVRHRTRYGLPDGVDLDAWLMNDGAEPLEDPVVGGRRARAGTLLILALPGSTYLYQGEELGLSEVAGIPRERLEDPIWERSGHARKGRDGCRVPLPWAQEGLSFGFGSAAPRLPQPAGFGALSVEAQADDPASSLQFYRAALRLRRELFAPGVPLVQRDLGEDLVAFRRGDVLVVGNLGDRPHPLPDGAVLLASGPLDGGAIPPDTTVWMRG